jgi:integrase
VKFPVSVKYYDQLAKIYRPAKGFPHYRVAFKVAGKRKMITFTTYGEAKEAAEAKVKDLHKGLHSAALTAKEAQQALDIRAKLELHQQETGIKLSAAEAIADYLAAIKLLPKGSTLLEAVRVYARSTLNLKPRKIQEGVIEFLQSRRTITKAGERSRLSPVYSRNLESWLTKFADTLPSHLVSDLAPEILEKYLVQFVKISAKARNDRRAAIGMFLRWCGRRELIDPQQLSKLLDCDALRKELVQSGKIAFYTPTELQTLLNGSEGPLQIVTALQAFGGARLEESLRLRYEDLHRIPDHIEISGQHAKTRQRRLLNVCPALLAWLEPFKGKAGPIWSDPLNSFISSWARLRESLGVVPKRNGLRHGFVSYSYILRGEIETSALAGTSPQILHKHYRGLARKEDAEAWFTIMPKTEAARAKAS